MAQSREDLPARVKGLRQRLNLTQEQFAQKVGVTYSTVNHWENGKRSPQPFLLRRLQEINEELKASGATLPEPRRAGQPVEREIRKMTRRIVRQFNPERVILFGSHARGDAGPDSDVDLLVVMAVKGSRREKAIEIRVALHDIRVPKDILVTTPEDFEWRKEIPGTIERPAAQEGKLLYARR